MLDADRRLSGEVRLILAILAQAVIDARHNDFSAILFLYSQMSKDYCSLIDLDHANLLRLCKSHRSDQQIRKRMSEML